MNKRLLIIGAAALAVLLSAAAWGCSTDTKDLEDRLDAVEAQLADGDGASSADMAGALIALRAAGLHGIDEDANDNNTVTAGAAGGVEAALLAVAAVEWPADLQAVAGEVQTLLQELLDALASEDPAVVGPPAAAAHEGTHEFEEGVGNAIREAAGLPVEEEEEEAEGTPAAETPEATATP